MTNETDLLTDPYRLQRTEVGAGEVLLVGDEQPEVAPGRWVGARRSSTGECACACRLSV